LKGENSRIRSRIRIHWPEARIRIRTKMSRIHNTASYVVIGLVPIELGEIGLGAFSSSKTDRDFSEPSLIMVNNETLPVPSIFNSIGGR